MKPAPLAPLLAALLVMGAVAPAFAADAPAKAKRAKPVFEAVDANRDGAVSRDELKAALAKHPRMLKRADGLFKRLDKNANGQLDKAEFDAMRAKHRRHGDKK